MAQDSRGEGVQRVGGSVRRSKRVAELMVEGGHDAEHGTEHEHDVKRGKCEVAWTTGRGSAELPHGGVLRCDGVRRSKRLAERMEGDTEHAHKRKKHEGVSRVVCDTVAPWRDK